MVQEGPIKQISETKFLGIIIDDKLTWNPQIQYLRGKLVKQLLVKQLFIFLAINT